MISVQDLWKSGTDLAAPAQCIAYLAVECICIKVDYNPFSIWYLVCCAFDKLFQAWKFEQVFHVCAVLSESPLSESSSWPLLAVLYWVVHVCSEI